MKLPKRVKIGARTYRVIKDYNFKKQDDDEDVMGMHNGMYGTIRIAPTGNDIHKFQILIHEMLHGIDAVYNSDKLEEDTVERLSQGLVQVLTDNFTIKPK